MAELFDKDVRTVSEHIGNLYAEGELEREATIRKFRIVRQEGKRQVRRDIDHYNLDVIISVGYRVKSQRGVQFRQWATRVLKEHLVQGYTLNQRRLEEHGVEFEQAVDLLSRTLANQGLVSAEGEAVARVISDYARSWCLHRVTALARRRGCRYLRLRAFHDSAALLLYQRHGLRLVSRDGVLVRMEMPLNEPAKA